jgi:hypothetical protein
MSGDFRETIIGCAASTCRFNIAANPERTCALKLIAVDETGRCRMAEAVPIPPQHPKPQAQTNPGHFEGGVWVQ